jgi:hypothetical protein
MTAPGKHSYELIQPSARRRAWELRQGGEVRALLEVPAVRPGGRARFADQQWQIKRRGALRPDHVVLDGDSGEQLACLRGGRRRRRLELGEIVAEWKRLPRGLGYGFSTPEGERLVGARLRAGLLRSWGEISVSARLPERDAVMLAVLASYLLIRRGEEHSASAVAVAASAGS